MRWVKFFPCDYAADTSHLTTVEHGAYIRLMVYYWVKESLPSDDDRLRRITGMTGRQWAASRVAIQALFGPDWRHKRIDRDIAEMHSLACAKSKAGKASAHAKSLKSLNGGSTPVQRKVNHSNILHTSSKVESYTEVETHTDKSEIDNLPRAKKSPARFFPKDGFDRFWQIYPRKVAKEAARKSFEKVLTAGKVTFDDLLTVVERFRADPGCDPEFIPHPTTWLNQGRYLDERLQAPPGMVEVERGKPYFEPLRRRFNRENGSDPQSTENGALLPSKWVQIAKDYTDEQDRLLLAGNGLCEERGSVGRGVSSH